MPDLRLKIRKAIALTKSMPEYTSAPVLPWAAKMLKKFSVKTTNTTNRVVRCGLVRPLRILAQ